MTMDVSITKDNVDHFLISTLEDQFLILWIGPKESENTWEN